MAPTPSALTERPSESVWAELRAPVWKAFRLDTGSFLLHVPTSHLLEVDPEVVSHVTGEKVDPEIETQLAEMVAGFPKPAPRQVETDIYSVSLNMAQGCNLRCTYCFAGEGDYGVKGMMTFETARSVLEFFTKGRERFEVVFFGGEPMLNFEVIKQVVAWCETQTCRFSFAMTTNGTLLSEERLQWLKEKRFSISWSYDGKSLQDRQRLLKDKKTGSGAIVARKLEAFQDALGKLRDFKVRTTVSRENLHLLEESLLNTLTATNFKLYFARHATSESAAAFTDEDIDKLGNILKSVVDRLLEERDYAKLLRVGNLRRRLKNIDKGTTGEMSCSAGVNYLTVSVEGNFYLCHRFNEDESENFGNVARGLDQERLTQIREARMAKKEPCSSCWVRQWCAGGCFHEHKAATGDKLQMDPAFCKLQAIETEQALRIYAAVREHAPALLEG
jgi:uncharacterized protein